MDGIKNLASTEHGILTILLIIAATVLAAMKIITPDAWQNFVQIIFGTFVVGHIGVSTASAIRARRAAPSSDTASKETK